MGIHFSAPQREFELISDQWFSSVKTLAQRGVFVGGPSVASFEALFAERSGTQWAVGVGNGTDALFLALKALGIGPGDEVITVANTFIATVEAIHHTGALPVLVDCEQHTYLMDLEQVKSKVSARTKAIIPVHLYGQMVDLRDMVDWAKGRGIAIIEDAAQAAGAWLDGKPAGSWGMMGCFSFYPDKNLGAIGDGGAIVTSSQQMVDTLRKLRNHGGEIRYQHDIPGFNSRLDPLQAIALELKLIYLNEWSAHRRLVAQWYEAYLDTCQSVILPVYRDKESHAFHLFVIRIPVEARDKLRKYLQKKGILSAIQYPRPVHLTPAFTYLGYDIGDFPICEAYKDEILSLPMHIDLVEEDVQFITNEIKQFLGLSQI